MSNIESKLVSELQGEFCIPAYHRDYHWKEEVNRLLNDFQEIKKGDNYYLKPIVVRKNENNRYELIDGQQRFITLYILLKHIEKFLPTSQLKFSIDYQTNTFSRKFQEGFDFNHTNITDEYFFRETTNIITGWFEEQEDETQTAIELWVQLSRKIHVIWYEVDKNDKL